jgi:uncharacterized Fe-S cluster-containing radical SAM superfamily protein
MRHPEAVFVQLTTGCNARCSSCPHPFTYGAVGKHPGGSMSRETWGLLIGQIAADGYHGQVGLYLHHEPLLVKDLPAKISDVNEKTDAFVVLSTNAALLTPERRAALIEARPRTVHVNISSADPAQYAAIMKLDWETTRRNTQSFIREARGKVAVEINCPVLPDVDVGLLRDAFPGVKVNTEFWANSRGGLLDGVLAKGKGSRFKLGGYCRQPDLNLNVLFDGSLIICCMDWGHESRRDLPTIADLNLFDIYRENAVMESARRAFRHGRYDRYKMCGACADEMGFARAC